MERILEIRFKLISLVGEVLSSLAAHKWYDFSGALDVFCNSRIDGAHIYTPENHYRTVIPSALEHGALLLREKSPFRKGGLNPILTVPFSRGRDWLFPSCEGGE
jgi:hypothetical protein